MIVTIITHYFSKHNLLHYKMRTLLTLLGLAICSLVSAQCFVSTIELNTQADIDAFPGTYGGCTNLFSVRIEIMGSTITSLAPLTALEEIGGLEIRSTSLTTLAGLENLLFIDGQLKIVSNSDLISLAGLDNLEAVNELTITGNSNLASIAALSGLTSAGFAITITDNSDLTGLDGLENVTAPSSRIELSSNYSLVDISALAGMDMTGMTGNPALRIESHEFLSDCAINSVCALLETSVPVAIQSNGLGAANSQCLDVGTVTAACSPAATCTDGIQNGDETEVDCGGSCVPCTCVTLTSISNVELRTQQEVDNFGVTHGGCVRINGNLLVSSGLFVPDPIENLDGLTGIREVTGDVLISSSPITSFAGLDRLSSIGGNLYIQGIEIEKLELFSNLNTVGGNFALRSSTIDTIVGPSNLTTVGWLVWFDVQTNYVDGFEQLNNARITLPLYPQATIAGFSGLTDAQDIYVRANEVTGFTNLATSGSIYIEGATISDQAFQNLVSTNNFTLRDYSGTSIPLAYGVVIGTNNSGSLRIIDCENLTSLEGITVGNDTLSEVRLDGCQNLSDISQLNGLTTIVGTLSLAHLPDITSLTGLNNLSFSSNLNIFECDGLTDLTGLSSLSNVDDLSITDCNGLIGLNGLVSLQRVNSIYIADNNNLSSLAGLTDADEDIFTQGFHVIYNNPVLITCANLHICRGIASGALYVSSNSPACQQDLDANCSALLPITLQAFTATSRPKRVQLAWSTSTEQNNAHFIVQTSTDGQNWRDIGRVAGGGTTNTVQGYTFTHTEPAPGNNYYRLRQEDFGGAYDYSPVRQVWFDGEAVLAVFPNPATEFITVSAGFLYEVTDYTVTVHDATGRQVIRQRNQDRVEVAQLPSGVYSLVLSGGGQRHTARFTRR